MTTDIRALPHPGPRPPPLFLAGVAVGVSAGGLAAVGRFFESVPKESGLAYVLVYQLAADFPNLRDELLTRRTELPIHLVENGTMLVADHVYLLPPDREMTLSGWRAVLSEPPRGFEHSRRVDVFFRSLARDAGPLGIAVVLSGGARGGASGIRAVHSAGGLVVVEDLSHLRGTRESPRSADVAGLASATRAADWVLLPDLMPPVLMEHVRRHGASYPQGHPVVSAPDSYVELAPQGPTLGSDVAPRADGALLGERDLLDSLLSSLPDAVYFKDALGRFIRINPPMASRLGLLDPSEAVGKTLLEMPNPAVTAVLHHDDEAVLRGSEVRCDRFERWERPGAASDWALVTRLPLRDRSGGIVGMIGLVHDVTEQKLADDKIQEAVRRRDQFLAMLSHELRNPLGAILTATSLLKKALDGSEHGRALAVLQRQSLQMARLLDDLLDANRVTENKIELRSRILDLRTVVREAADAVRGRMDVGGLLFRVTLDAAAVWVDGDAARLQQILVNLLDNAAKNTPAGGHVLVALAREDDNAILRVVDDGAGIASDMLDAVFELFVQTGYTLDRARGGLGLGLTLVRSLVAMHGGTVSAHSGGEGKGAEFVVRLPLAPGAVIGEAAGTRPPGHSQLRLPRHAKIAIIEDNQDSREMLFEALSVAGFDCKTTDNGVDGLALIEAVRPDLAIIDVGLPAMNGFELARRIRAEPKHASVRLVALTGYGQREDRDRALAAGFDDHLVKPIETTALLSYIEGDAS